MPCSILAVSMVGRLRARAVARVSIYLTYLPTRHSTYYMWAMFDYLQCSGYYERLRVRAVARVDCIDLFY